MASFAQPAAVGDSHGIPPYEAAKNKRAQWVREEAEKRSGVRAHCTALCDELASQRKAATSNRPKQPKPPPGPLSVTTRARKVAQKAAEPADPAAPAAMATAPALELAVEVEPLPTALAATARLPAPPAAVAPAEGANTQALRSMFKLLSTDAVMQRSV